MYFKIDMSAFRRPPSVTLLRLPVVFLLLFVFLLELKAQWKTETFTLKRGWNAIYLHVDCSYDTIDHLLPANSPITDIWGWKAQPSTLKTMDDPRFPKSSEPDWLEWNYSSPTNSRLQRLAGNAAYVVRLDPNYSFSSFTLQVKGKPLAPRYTWSSLGLNFIGFSTKPAGAPTFNNFLRQSTGFLETTELYRYLGSELTNNPTVVPDFLKSGQPVTRGEAYWIRRRSGFDAYNRYYGPFEVEISGADELAFRDSLGRHTVRLRNTTTNNLTVTMQMVPSETVPVTAPVGTPVPAGPPPLLIRGALNVTNLTYGSIPFVSGAFTNILLKPAGQVGSEVELVVGINRAALSTVPGTFYAGILRFTDANFMQIDIGVSAQAPSSAGLWVGAASVDEVQNDISKFARDAASNSLIVSTNPETFGQYILTNRNTSLGKVARPFPLRLIIHEAANGASVLLQHVFLGTWLETNFVVATRESRLDQNNLANARRISAAHLPWSADNVFWTFTNSGPSQVVTVPLQFDEQASNPFIHAYHPDHDNLNTQFNQPLDQGVESYSVVRQIKLTPSVDGVDFDSLTKATLTKGGTYQETITFLGKQRSTTVGGTNQTFTTTRTNYVQGVYSISRISDIATLTQ